MSDRSESSWTGRQFGDYRILTDHDETCVSLLEESSFHSLYSDPRFADLLRRIGLPAVK